MDEEHISVRALSKESGVSTSVIQNMRSMKPTNITIKTMASLLKPLGYQLSATNGKKNCKIDRLGGMVEWGHILISDLYAGNRISFN